MLALILTLACSSNGAKVVLPDDTASLVDVDTGTTDTGGEDTAGGDGTDTTDSAPPPEDISGDYVGRVTGTLEPLEGGGGREPRPMDCDGELSLTIDSSGAARGVADCITRDGFGPEGAVEGTARDGALDLTWTVRAGRDTQEIALSGTVGGGTVTLDGTGDDGRMHVTVHLEARR
jgi:hypothetical protein